MWAVVFEHEFTSKLAKILIERKQKEMRSLM